MTKELDAAQFEAALRQIGIPPRPAILELVAGELRKDDPDFAILERALKSDVAIAAGIIKTANSPVFGLRRRVRTVLEALQVMGLRMAAQVVACVALREAFPDRRLERFWDASVKVAGLSSWLVGINRWPGVEADDAYTFGLFKDCGIAILMQRMPNYQDVLKEANGDAARSFTECEEAVLPVSHAQVGAMLTQSWWLPVEITEGVRHHHNPVAISPTGTVSGLPVKSAFLIAISQLAEYLLQQNTGLCQTREWEKLGEACLRRLALDEVKLSELVTRSGEVVAEI